MGAFNMEKALVVAFSGHRGEGSLTALMASRQKYCVSVRPDSETGTISAVLSQSNSSVQVYSQSILYLQLHFSLLCLRSKCFCLLVPMK